MVQLVVCDYIMQEYANFLVWERHAIIKNSNKKMAILTSGQFLMQKKHTTLLFILSINK